CAEPAATAMQRNAITIAMRRVRACMDVLLSMAEELLTGFCTIMCARMHTVRDAVIGLLRDLGMTTIFGNPGSTELPLFKNFPDDFRYVLGLQESVVVGMADGVAPGTRNAAVVSLHSAAGVGHAMGNIFTAYRNRTPLVITAGQQARSILPYAPFLFSA